MKSADIQLKNWINKLSWNQAEINICWIWVQTEFDPISIKLSSSWAPPNLSWVQTEFKLSSIELSSAELHLIYTDFKLTASQVETEVQAEFKLSSSWAQAYFKLS